MEKKFYASKEVKEKKAQEGEKKTNKKILYGHRLSEIKIGHRQRSMGIVLGCLDVVATQYRCFLEQGGKPNT